MQRSSRWVLVPTLLIALLGGCEAAIEPAAETAQHVPSAPSLELIDGEYEPVEAAISEDAVDLEVSRLIDSDGGSLHLAGHSLQIPAGAVAQPTLFTMTVLTNGYVEVELRAIEADPFGEDFDVGESGFGDKTVALTLSYAGAKNVDEPGSLVILRMPEDENGTAQPLDVVVDTERRTVTAQLDHFSKYCLASS